MSEVHSNNNNMEVIKFNNCYKNIDIIATYILNNY